MTTLSDIIGQSALLTVDNTKTVTNKTISGASNTIDNLNASNLSSGTVDTARLASGTADATTYLRGDQTWAAAGLNYFTDSENTTAPNDTKPVDVLTAANAGTDVDVAIVPKGTGAFSLQVPDNAVTGGNKRGPNAIDLQTTRNNANEVASGYYSFVAGKANKATTDAAVALGLSNASLGTGAFTAGFGNDASTYSTAIGYSNFARGTGAVSLGYNTSTGYTSYSFAAGRDTYANSTGAVALGQDSQATSDYATAIGYSNLASLTGATSIGYDNTATGIYSTAIGRNNQSTGNSTVALGYSNNVSGAQAGALGFSNTVSTNYSFAAGYLNTVSGISSVAMGTDNSCSASYSLAVGTNNSASGAYNFAMGRYANTKGRRSTLSIGAYTNAGNYNTNTSIFTAGTKTTDATPTALTTLTSTSESYWNFLDNNSAYTLKILAVGMDTTTYDVKSWEISALVKNVTGILSIVGTPTKTVVAQDTGASAWDVNLVLGTTQSAFTIQATGAAASTINWTATMYAAEVKI